MRHGWLSLGALAFIAGTVGIKLAVQNATVDEDRGAGVQALAAGLARAGYRAEAISRIPPRLDASRGPCRLAMRIIDPHATFEPRARKEMPPGWALAFGWRGSWYAALPRVGPLIEFYSLREFARIGFVRSRAPVVLLATAPGCSKPPARLADIRLDLIVKTEPALSSPPQ